MSMLMQKEVRKKRRRRRISLNQRRRSIDTEKSSWPLLNSIQLIVKVEFRDHINHVHNVHKEFIWPNILTDIIVEHVIKHSEWMKQQY